MLKHVLFENTLQVYILHRSDDECCKIKHKQHSLWDQWELEVTKWLPYIQKFILILQLSVWQTGIWFITIVFGGCIPFYRSS